MIFFFFRCIFFFNPTDRPTQYQETHSMLNEKKGGGVGDGVISDKDTAERYVQVPVPRKPNKLSFH